MTNPNPRTAKGRAQIREYHVPMFNDSAWGCQCDAQGNYPCDTIVACDEIKRLRGALEKYGKHPLSCHVHCRREECHIEDPTHAEDKLCTCGLDAALSDNPDPKS